MKDYDLIHQENDGTTIMSLYYSNNDNNTILTMVGDASVTGSFTKNNVSMLRILKTFCLDTAYIKLERLMKIKKIKSKMNERL